MRILELLVGLLVGAATCSAQIPGNWTYAAGEFPAMHLIFRPDGRLTFAGGFEYWNPAQWQYDSAVGELRITIPKLSAKDTGTLQEDLRQGFIKRFDPRAKTVTYEYSDSTFTLTLAGFVYVRDSVQASNRNRAP